MIQGFTLAEIGAPKSKDIPVPDGIRGVIETIITRFPVNYTVAIHWTNGGKRRWFMPQQVEGSKEVVLNVLGIRWMSQRTGLGRFRVDCISVDHGLIPPALTLNEKRDLHGLLWEQIALILAPVGVGSFAFDLLDLEEAVA